MSMTRLKSDTHFTLQFELPRPRRSVDFFAESELPVRVFIVDDDELATFRKGDKYAIYGSSQASRRHEKRVRLPSGTWNFVIVNPNKTSVAVFYELT